MNNELRVEWGTEPNIRIQAWLPVFIHIRPDGLVDIEGGLVFHPGVIVKNEANGAGHRITNNHFVGTHPRWWELRAWWRLIQLIRKHTRPHDSVPIL